MHAFRAGPGELSRQPFFLIFFFFFFPLLRFCLLRRRGTTRYNVSYPIVCSTLGGLFLLTTIRPHPPPFFCFLLLWVSVEAVEKPNSIFFCSFSRSRELGVLPVPHLIALQHIPSSPLSLASPPGGDVSTCRIYDDCALSPLAASSLEALPSLNLPAPFPTAIAGSARANIRAPFSVRTRMRKNTSLPSPILPSPCHPCHPLSRFVLGTASECGSSPEDRRLCGL